MYKAAGWSNFPTGITEYAEALAKFFPIMPNPCQGMTIHQWTQFHELNRFTFDYMGDWEAEVMQVTINLTRIGAFRSQEGYTLETDYHARIYEFEFEGDVKTLP